MGGSFRELLAITLCEERFGASLDLGFNPLILTAEKLAHGPLEYGLVGQSVSKARLALELLMPTDPFARSSPEQKSNLVL